MELISHKYIVSLCCLCVCAVCFSVIREQRDSVVKKRRRKGPRTWRQDFAGSDPPNVGILMSYRRVLFHCSDSVYVF